MMFSLKNKLSPDLKIAVENKIYKSFRVIIHCKNLQKNIESKISSYKGSLIRSITKCSLISAQLTPHAIERLIEFPEVNYISFDKYSYICGNSIQSSNGIRLAEKYKLTGKGIGIGIIDTGVYPHSDLINPVNRIKHFVDLINGCKYPYDDNGHGTFVSGLIGGNGLSSKGIYKGIAENSSICCYKAFNSKGRAYISDVLYSIQGIIEQSKELNIRVLCLPFEIAEYDFLVNSYFSILFEEAAKANIITIVPSGSNDNIEGSIRGLAILPNCITVGGIDTSKDKTSYKYSSSGPVAKLEKPDLVAACVDIIGLNCNSNYISERKGSKVYPYALEDPYTSYSGTSCAAAYIAGICALLLENNPNLGFKDILSLLKVSCNLIEIPKALQGSGVININKLLP